MVIGVDVQRRMAGGGLALVVVLGLVASGCGDDDDFANEPRPPAAITVSAAISANRVSVSPSRLGAGTVELIASNQTATSQRLTLRSRSRSGGNALLEQTTGPINPGDTASLRADLAEGSYLVSARSNAIDPATLVVSAKRQGAGLLQP